LDHGVMSEFEKLSGGIKTIKKLWLKLIMLGVLALIAVGIAYSSFYFEGALFRVAIFLCAAVILTGFVLSVILSSKRRKLKDLISENVTRDLLDEAFDVSEHNVKGYINRSLVAGAGLINNWDRCSGSDLVRGRYKGFGIQFSDVLLEEEVVSESTDTDDEGNSRRVTSTSYEKRFKGQWIIIDMAKEFPAWLRLREKGKRETICGKGSIETENAIFNNQFYIEANDAHTALLILTPHFMEAILAANREARGRTHMYFCGKQIHIAIDNDRDLFEIDKKDMDLSAARERIKGEVKYLTDIMDIIMSNEKLF